MGCLKEVKTFFCVFLIMRGFVTSQKPCPLCSNWSNWQDQTGVNQGQTSNYYANIFSTVSSNFYFIHCLCVGFIASRHSDIKMGGPLKSGSGLIEQQLGQICGDQQIKVNQLHICKSVSRLVFNTN